MAKHDKLLVQVTVSTLEEGALEIFVSQTGGPEEFLCVLEALCRALSGRSFIPPTLEELKEWAATKRGNFVIRAVGKDTALQSAQ